MYEHLVQLLAVRLRCDQQRGWRYVAVTCDQQRSSVGPVIYIALWPRPSVR